jgi:hypothetical protein
VRTKRYTYVRRLAGPWLLYDNQTDPYQMTNLVDNPAYAALQADLQLQLDELLCKTGDTFQSREEIFARCGYDTGNKVSVPCRDELVCDANAPTVDAGIDMITWSGRYVQLAPTVEDNYGTALTYKWSASPSAGVSFSPNANDPAPRVTITNAPTSNPTTVTITLAVNNTGRTGPDVKDTLEIDVYDDPCKAAIGKGLKADHPTDLVGDDCVTDIKDLAELAAKWLNDKSLESPILK